MRPLTTILTILAAGLAIVIVLAIVRRDPPIAPRTSASGAATGDACHSVSSGDVDLIARHAACEVACTKNDMPACGLAATDYVTGLGAPPDGTRAQELYEKACASREAPSACLLLGDLLDDGALVTRDIERAKDAWSRGCAQGDRSSCARLDGGP